MAAEEPGPLRVAVVPLDAATHDRAAFRCGNEPIDNFLKRTARTHQQGDFTRVWVAVAPRDAKILGYYAVNAHAVEGNDLPQALTGKATRHGAVPAAYLSMLGVDLSVRGRGLGKVLLADALKRIALISEQLGIAAMVLDILDDGDRAAVARRWAFYESFGFTAFPSQPMRLFLPTRTVRERLGE